jgi:hypothetical protein
MITAAAANRKLLLLGILFFCVSSYDFFAISFFLPSFAAGWRRD